MFPATILEYPTTNHKWSNSLLHPFLGGRHRVHLLFLGFKALDKLLNLIVRQSVSHPVRSIVLCKLTFHYQTRSTHTQLQRHAKIKNLMMIIGTKVIITFLLGKDRYSGKMAARVQAGGTSGAAPSLLELKQCLLLSYLQCSERGLLHSANWYKNHLSDHRSIYKASFFLFYYDIDG